MTACHGNRRPPTAGIPPGLFLSFLRLPSLTHATLITPIVVSRPCSIIICKALNARASNPSGIGSRGFLNNDDWRAFNSRHISSICNPGFSSGAVGFGNTLLRFPGRSAPDPPSFKSGCCLTFIRLLFTATLFAPTVEKPVVKVTMRYFSDDHSKHETTLSAVFAFSIEWKYEWC